MNRINVSKGAIFSETKSINVYLNEIKKIQLLTNEEENNLKINYSNRYIDKLITSNLRFVTQVARKYAGMGIDVEDLISFGNLGLIKAAKKFDPTKGFKFISFAVWYVRAEITKALDNYSRTVRIPSHKTNVEESKTVNFDSPVNIEKSPESYGDRYLQSEREKSNLEIEDLKKDLDRALKTLKPKQRKAIEMYYCIGHDFSKSMDQIGKEMNVTKERVRQLINQAIEKLRFTDLNYYISA